MPSTRSWRASIGVLVRSVDRAGRMQLLGACDVLLLLLDQPVQNLEQDRLLLARRREHLGKAAVPASPVGPTR